MNHQHTRITAMCPALSVIHQLPTCARQESRAQRGIDASLVHCHYQRSERASMLLSPLHKANALLCRCSARCGTCVVHQTADGLWSMICEDAASSLASHAQSCRSANQSAGTALASLAVNRTHAADTYSPVAGAHNRFIACRVRTRCMLSRDAVTQPGSASYPPPVPSSASYPPPVPAMFLD